MTVAITPTDLLLEVDEDIATSTSATSTLSILSAFRDYPDVELDDYEDARGDSVDDPDTDLDSYADGEDHPSPQTTRRLFADVLKEQYNSSRTGNNIRDYNNKITTDTHAAVTQITFISICVAFVFIFVVTPTIVAYGGADECERWIIGGNPIIGLQLACIFTLAPIILGFFANIAALAYYSSLYIDPSALPEISSVYKLIDSKRILDSTSTRECIDETVMIYNDTFYKVGALFHNGEILHVYSISGEGN